VTDSGIGISEAVQARLFAAFTQADGSTTRKYGGTGLGLAISTRLVELMGGEIGLRSTPGMGSTFWFTARFQNQPPGTSREPEPAGELAGRRILIVDDNKTNRLVLRHQLGTWGVDEHAVSSGPEALTALRAAAAIGRPFDLAILDRQMPGMDGLTLAREIKQDQAIADTGLIMMTSLGDTGDGPDIKESGILTCLTKPVKRAQIRECLLRVLTESALSPVSVTREAPPASVAAVSHGRVLVAEDNMINQKVALSLLRKLGYSADAVANGAEAVEAIGRIRYDIVLMDCQMPEVDGYEATRRIRSRSDSIKSVPIIAMTASALPGDREKCLEAGMNDYITKPINVPELLAALTRVKPKPAPEIAEAALTT
jgi:CheY-like chemotaxis protein